MHKQYIQEEIDRELAEFQTKRAWISEANKIYYYTFFCCAGPKIFGATDWYASEGRSPKEYVQDFVDEERSYQMYLDDLMSNDDEWDACTYCGDPACEGQCKDRWREKHES